MNLLGTQDMSVSQDPTAPPAAIAATIDIANLMHRGGGVGVAIRHHQDSTKYK